MEGQFADVKAPVLGPAAAQMVKVMGRYRYHLTIRAKDCVMKTVTNVREGAEDIYADAKAINERRAAEAAPEVIENTSADAE